MQDWLCQIQLNIGFIIKTFLKFDSSYHQAFLELLLWTYSYIPFNFTSLSTLIVFFLIILNVLPLHSIFYTSMRVLTIIITITHHNSIHSLYSFFCLSKKIGLWYFKKIFTNSNLVNVTQKYHKYLSNYFKYLIKDLKNYTVKC